MGNSEAAGNVTRLQGRMLENDGFRDEAKAAIADIKDSRVKSQRAGAIAEQLAKGTDADVQAVIDNAPAIIDEFRGIYDAADQNVNSISDAGELLSSKINTLNNKVTLTDKESTNLTKWNIDIQKMQIQLFSAVEKLQNISAALVLVENSFAQA